jgi:PKD repeat protein
LVLRRKRNCIFNKRGATSILESLVAIGISITIVSGYLITIESHYKIHETNETDLKVKSQTVMESITGSTGKSKSFNLNWEKDNSLIKVLGLRASNVVEYGIIEINSTSGESQIVSDRYPKDVIGIENTCFIGGTKIVMSDKSYKNIEEINIGDLVKSYDELKKEIVDKKVIQVFHHSPEEMGEYYLLINDILGVTPNHNIYSDNGWKTADNLKIGDSLFSPSSNFKVESIAKIFEKTNTYNFEVEGNHNYFVVMQKNDILVHNAPVPPPQLYADAGGPYSYTSHCPVSFSATANGGVGPYIYQWDFDYDFENFDIDAEGKNPQYTYTTCGFYNVLLKVTDSMGTSVTDSTTAECNMVVNAYPIADPGKNNDDCNCYKGVKNQPITFDASGSKDGDECGYTIVGYEWDWGLGTGYDPVMYNTPIVYHTYNSSGDYTVILRVTDNENSKSTDTVTVNVFDDYPDLEAKLHWFDTDGLGPGKQIMLNAEESLYAQEYAFYKIEGETVTELRARSTDPFFILPNAENPVVIKLVIWDSMNNVDSIIKTVQANTFDDDYVKPTQEPWILTGKFIYPNNEQIKFIPYGNDYFVELSNENTTEPGVSRFIYEVKQKSNTNFFILDQNKILRSPSNKDSNVNKMYQLIKEDLGLTSIKSFYNFKLEIFREGVKMKEFGYNYSNAFEVQSSSINALVRIPPMSSDGITIIHPSYYPVEIIVYVFIGGSPPDPDS